MWANFSWAATIPSTFGKTVKNNKSLGKKNTRSQT